VVSDTEPKDWNDPVNLPDDDPLAVLQALLAVDPESDPAESDIA
jgi:hypothetical protein